MQKAVADFKGLNFSFDDFFKSNKSVVKKQVKDEKVKEVKEVKELKEMIEDDKK